MANEAVFTFVEVPTDFLDQLMFQLGLIRCANRLFSNMLFEFLDVIVDKAKKFISFVGDIVLWLDLHVLLESVQTKIYEGKRMWHFTIKCLLGKGHILLNKRFAVLFMRFKLGL